MLRSKTADIYKDHLSTLPAGRGLEQVNRPVATTKGADYMTRAGSVEGLALSAEMTVQPGVLADLDPPPQIWTPGVHIR